jgi:hypothetical protein
LKGVARVRLLGGRIRLAEIHWYEAQRYWEERVQAEVAVFRLAMKKAEKQSAQFVVCLNNEDYVRPVAKKEKAGLNRPAFLFLSRCDSRPSLRLRSQRFTA